MVIELNTVGQITHYNIKSMNNISKYAVIYRVMKDMCKVTLFQKVKESKNVKWIQLEAR